MIPPPPPLGKEALTVIEEPCSISVFESGHKEPWDAPLNREKTRRVNRCRYGLFDDPNDMLRYFRARFGPIKYHTFGRLAWIK